MEKKSYSIPKVKAEYDYTKFNILDRNRIISKAHVKQLAEDIKEHGQQIPVIVNEHMDIIDGQHRLAALSAIGYPVLYYMTNGMDVNDVGRLNTLQATWGEKDWIHNYAAGGSKSYTALEKSKEKYPDVPYRTLLYAYCGNSFPSQYIRAGKVEITAEELAAGKEALKYLAKFRKIMSIVPGSKRAFSCAILWCAHHEDKVNLDRLCKRVTKDIWHAKGYARVLDWLSWFEETNNKYLGDCQYFVQLYKQEVDQSKKKGAAKRQKAKAAEKAAKKSGKPKQQTKYAKPVRKVHSLDADLFRAILGSNTKIMDLADIQNKAS